MRENVRVGREVVADKVRYELNLSADREADKVVKVVLNTIVVVIRENIDTDGFTLKLYPHTIQVHGMVSILLATGKWSRCGEREGKGWPEG